MTHSTIWLKYIANIAIQYQSLYDEAENHR